MKRKFIRTQNIFIAFLMSILGFGSACTEKEISPGYGSFTATYFKVYGKITTENGDDIRAIKVTMLSNTYVADSLMPFHDSAGAYTDYYGNYVLNYASHLNSRIFRLKFEDVDGLALNEYQTKDTIITFGNVRQTNTTKEVNTKLKEKE